MRPEPSEKRDSWNTIVILGTDGRGIHFKSGHRQIIINYEEFESDYFIATVPVANYYKWLPLTTAAAQKHSNFKLFINSVRHSPLTSSHSDPESGLQKRTARVAECLGGLREHRCSFVGLPSGEKTTINLGERLLPKSGCG